MADRKHTTFVILRYVTGETNIWQELPVVATGASADAALLAALDREDLDLAEGDIVSLVPNRSWRPATVAVETKRAVRLKR